MPCAFRLPAVAVRLRRVIARGDYGIGELERIAGEDQSLAATLLRYANSAVYRRVTPTTTLGAAIMRIGATEVARISLALSVGGFAVESGPLAAIRFRVWRQALVAALCCRALAYCGRPTLKRPMYVGFCMTLDGWWRWLGLKTSSAARTTSAS